MGFNISNFGRNTSDVLYIKVYIQNNQIIPLKIHITDDEKYHNTKVLGHKKMARVIWCLSHTVMKTCNTSDVTGVT